MQTKNFGSDNMTDYYVKGQMPTYMIKSNIQK